LLAYPFYPVLEIFNCKNLSFLKYDFFVLVIELIEIYDGLGAKVRVDRLRKPRQIAMSHVHKTGNTRIVFLLSGLFQGELEKPQNNSRSC